MSSPLDEVAAAVDQEALVGLVLEAVRIPSVTPGEMAFAQWARTQLEEGAWNRVRLVEAEPGRPNVYAGTGGAGGRSLVLAGHLDTVHADDWVREWSGTDRADPFAGHIVDGEIWARGATDQKAGVCSIIEAVRAVDRAGYRLAGPLTGVLVCDEESGQPGSGLSVGMRAAVSHLFDSPGPVPEFAIYTEPTTGAIYTAQMGFLIADITVAGRSAYFGTPELGVDALRAGHSLLGELWDHNATLQRGPAPRPPGQTLPAGHLGRGGGATSRFPATSGCRSSRNCCPETTSTAKPPRCARSRQGCPKTTESPPRWSSRLPGITPWEGRRTRFRRTIRASPH